MKKHVLLSLLIVSVLGCDRLKLDEPSKLQIQLPGTFTGANKTSDSNVVAMGTRPVPTGMTGSQPINCYLIAAGGPEEALQRNTCGRKDGTTTFATRKVGPWVGGAPAGSSLSIDVPSGIDRVIYVVGFYAATASACRDFKVNGFPPDAELSKPYIVGEVGKLTLNPGETKDLPLQVTFSTDKYFDGCDGPDFPSSGTGGGGTIGSGSTPTVIEIKKEWFPYNSFVTNSCQSFDLVLKDSQGRHASFTQNIDVTPQITFNAAAQAFYSNYQDCLNNVNSKTAVTIPAGTDRGQVVFKTDISPTTVNLGIASTTAPSALTYSGVGAYQVFSSSLSSFDLVGPWNILPDICYPYTAQLKYMTGSLVSGNTAVISNLTVGSGLSVFTSLADCQNNISTTQLNFAASIPYLSVYLKINSTAADNTPITLTDSAAVYTSQTKFIEKGYGDTTPSAVVINGHNQMTGVNSCANEPHEVFIINQYHAPLIVNAATSVTLSSTGVSLHANQSDCSANISPISNVSIPAGGYSGKFYVRTTSVGTATVTAQVTGLASNTYPINVDGPYQWELTSTASSLISNGSCIPLNATLKNFSGGVAQNFYQPFTFTVTGMGTPAYYGTYYDSACSSVMSSFETPSTGPATKVIYFKPTLNGASSPLNITIGISAGSIPINSQILNFSVQ